MDFSGFDEQLRNSNIEQSRIDRIENIEKKLDCKLFD